MKKLIGVAFIICFAGLSMFPLMNLGYKVMVDTSTPAFCASCHEIKPAVEAWKTSSHASNAKGFAARCMDCHLPPPEQTMYFFFSKAKHGIKDFWGHYFGEPYDAAQRRKIVYSTMTNDNCLKCHQNILYISEKRGAMLAHRTALFGNEGKGESCFECHRELVHVKRGLYSSN
jgi:cytochrome c nitrite reductase small subunit